MAISLNKEERDALLYSAGNTMTGISDDLSLVEEELEEERRPARKKDLRRERIELERKMKVLETACRLLSGGNR